MTDTALKWPADTIERRDIETLIPYARNSNTHSDRQIDQIAASIREWGWTMPVLVDEEGTILAGHGRVQAARRLGIEEVPVMVAEGWTETQRRAYVIADNRLAEISEWDNDILRIELEALAEVDQDAFDLTGFEDADLAALIEGLEPDGEGSVEEVDDIEPPPNPISREGDVWELGPHVLGCGDATSEEALKEVVGSVMVDMVWTDPPYGVAYVGKTADALTIQNDELVGEALEGFLRMALGNALGVCREGAVWYVAAPAGPNFLPFANVLTDLGVWRQTLVWEKNAFVLGRSDYHYRHEAIFYGWTPGAAHQAPPTRDQDTIWKCDRPSASPDHPTTKPMALIERAINNSTKRGGVVLDPFSGSGSTILACESTGRVGRGVELSPAYCDVIIRRWQDMSGGEAKLNGETFASVRIQRGMGANAVPGGDEADPPLGGTD